ncbi:MULTISPECIES: class I SAM-dependent methyltransferase [unclassified Nitrospina]|uniref:class I SAM-dependent methyltransferase n=1 Tax=unclassified Nitrospina TaxID=2638683 RepID=UPI003F9C5DE2
MNLPLPPPEMRRGGPRYLDDAKYIKSGVQNAQMLESTCGIGPDSRILDVGCGQARLLRGLLSYFGRIQRYVGVDVHEPSIRWLQSNIAPLTPFAEFYHVPFQNARYNPHGTRTLDFDISEKFDCITLISVFSHMRLADITLYLDFIHKAIVNEGKVYLTLFVEDDVPEEEENPDGYYKQWSGALHCVRLNRQEFEKRIRQAGFQVELFHYRNANDGQSSYMLGLNEDEFIPR